MKSRLAKKIAKTTFAYQNWDSNYQPYSVPQQQKMITKTPYGIESKKAMLEYGVFRKVPIEYRRCNTVQIVQLFQVYDMHPKSVKEYRACMKRLLMH